MSVSGQDERHDDNRQHRQRHRRRQGTNDKAPGEPGQPASSDRQPDDLRIKALGPTGPVP